MGERIACVQLIAYAAYTRRFDETHQKREHGASSCIASLLLLVTSLYDGSQADGVMIWTLGAA